MEERRRAKSQRCQRRGTSRTTAIRGWRSDGWTARRGSGAAATAEEEKEDLAEGAASLVMALAEAFGAEAVRWWAKADGGAEEAADLAEKAMGSGRSG